MQPCVGQNSVISCTELNKGSQEGTLLIFANNAKAFDFHERHVDGAALSQKDCCLR